MPNLFDTFQQEIVGSSGRLIDYTSKLSASGNFSKIYDLDVIINSWNNILLTPKGRKDHDPDFGSNLHLFIFEPADDETKKGIKEEIFRCLSTFDDRATISQIDIEYLRNKKGFDVAIVVNYLGNKSLLNYTFNESTFLM